MHPNKTVPCSGCAASTALQTGAREVIGGRDFLLCPTCWRGYQSSDPRIVFKVKRIRDVASGQQADPRRARPL
jgi:hypothetical protein